MLAVGYGQPPWISLVLAFSFATYGLIKKKINIGGLESLAAETAVLFLPALGYLLWLGRHRLGHLRHRGRGPRGSARGHRAWSRRRR